MYDGSFIKGRREGYGKLSQNEELMFYDGEWLQDKRHGFGKQTWPDKSFFQGTWSQGHIKKGIFTWPDGSTYQGDWEDSLMSGEGILKVKQPTEIMKGKWFNGKLHGKGSRQLVDAQELYEGDWVEGKLNGVGKLTSKDEWYEGIFKDNLEHGKGLKVYANGNKY